MAKAITLMAALTFTGLWLYYVRNALMLGTADDFTMPDVVLWDHAFWGMIVFWILTGLVDEAERFGSLWAQSITNKKG